MPSNTKSARLFRLPDQRRNELCDLADFIANDHFANRRIEPAELADKKGIPIKFNHYGDSFDGALEHKAGRFFIYINLDRVERPSSPRARFTLGHELGHYFIDDHRNALCSGSMPSHPSKCEFESRNPVEMEADHFASCLLMPATRFVAKAKKCSVGWQGIQTLCDEFGTSRTSTAVRYVSLNPRPCAIIKWNTDGYGWKWLSTSFFAARLRRTIEDTDRIAIGSATAKALSGEEPGSRGFFQNGSIASAWFPCIRPGTTLDVILIEEAIPIGRFGVLTLLYPESGSLPQIDW